MEKARYYFPNHSYTGDGFHSVIYKDKHTDDPYKEKRTVHSNGCGLTEDVSHWMDRIQNSADEEDEIVVVPLVKDQIKGIKKHDNITRYEHVNNNRIYGGNNFESLHPHMKYSEEANSRTKRATARYQERNTCSLYIQTDPLIWRHIRESIPDHNDPSRAAIVDEKAKEEILSLVAHHVAAVNFIYREL